MKTKKKDVGFMVYHKEGWALYFTFRMMRADAINEVASAYGSKWETLKENGYTVKKVELTVIPRKGQK